MSPSGERVGIGGGSFHGIGFALIPRLSGRRDTGDRSQRDQGGSDTHACSLLKCSVSNHSAGRRAAGRARLGDPRTHAPVQLCGAMAVGSKKRNADAPKPPKGGNQLLIRCSRARNGCRDLVQQKEKSPVKAPCMATGLAHSVAEREPRPAHPVQSRRPEHAGLRRTRGAAFRYCRQDHAQRNRLHPGARGP